jgi:hypothetical protein
MGFGCSCPVRVKEDDDSDNTKSGKTRLSLNKKNFSGTMRFQISVYHGYEYKNTSYASTNLLIYTNIDNFHSEFYVVDETNKGNPTSSIYKNSGIAIGYMKGYKLDVQNQDKFFVLVDGETEIYCVIDGHGPFGNIIAQMIQDKFFKELTECVFEESFDSEHERIFRNLFESTQNMIIRKEGKYKDDYDPFLSGAAVTLVVKKDSYLYSANVGNILGFIMYSERAYSYGFKTKVVVTDDSNFKVDGSTHQANANVTNNIHNTKVYYNVMESNIELNT